VPNENEIRDTYEKMNIFVVKKTGYSIEYINRMPIFEFLPLFETCKTMISER